MNEFKVKFASILKADTTLRSLLSKVADPYGVYFTRPPEKPTFPIVTYKIIGGLVDGAGRDSQTRNFVLVVSAYSKTNCDQILERIESLVNLSVAFSGMTSCKVEQVILEDTGGDEFDPEFQVYVRSYRYRVWLWKKPTR